MSAWKIEQWEDGYALVVPEHEIDAHHAEVIKILRWLGEFAPWEIKGMDDVDLWIEKDTLFFGCAPGWYYSDRPYHETRRYRAGFFFERLADAMYALMLLS